MKNIITVTEKALSQIKKIINESPNGTEGILIGIDKSGCSGYSYKIEFANKLNTVKTEYVEENFDQLYLKRCLKNITN